MKLEKICVAIVVVSAVAGVRVSKNSPKAINASLTPLASAQQPHAASPRTVAAQKTLALTQTNNLDDQQTRDAFAWKIFAAISAPEDSSAPAPGLTPQNNDTVWEDWADNVDTFRAVDVTPVFPVEQPFARAEALRLKHLQADQVLKLFKTGPHNSNAVRSAVLPPAARLVQVAAAAQANPHLPRVPAIPPVPRPGAPEEVRRNEIAFNSIVTQKAWYAYGLKQMVESRPNTIGVQGNVFQMAPGSIQVKAVWTPLPCATATACGAQNAKYHVNYSGTQRLGLVALHIMAKVGTKWIWATWEWAGNGNTADGLDGNPGRCDTSCSDDYGVQREFAHTNRQRTLGARYAPEPLSEDLLNLFAANHLRPEWKNYRLKGTQLDYETPALLGNSQIEKPYVPSSSCATCHSRASVNTQGNATVALNDDVHPIFTGTGRNKVGPTGPTQDAWFKHGNEQVFFRTDSVWSFVHTTN